MWSNNHTINNENQTKYLDIINSNILDNEISLAYQTAHGFSTGILQFIDNLIQLKPSTYKDFNTKKIKNDYNILNQLISCCTYIDG